MSCQQFKSLNLHADRLAIIETANKVINDYMRQGMKLSLRQLYYQFIAQDLFPSSWIDPEYNARNGLQPNTKNTEKNYKRLGSVINDGRLIGEIDWDAIEDRGRDAVVWRDYVGMTEFLDELRDRPKHYCTNPWRTQAHYVEVWVEKDALSGVLQPVCSRFHCVLMANKGYSSQSAMYENAMRIRERCEEWGAYPTVLYLGDHDPSGEDMVRDVEDRLSMFGCNDLTVKKVALTYAQIQQYKPPPNPAKLTDSRAPKYIEQFGRDSWELDALNPTTLAQLVEKELKALIDKGSWDNILGEDLDARGKLQKKLNGIKL